MRSVASITIFSIASVVILGDLGINLAPLLASAGVVGVAIGFGAQSMVRDYLAGIFMLVEDQYGVGDVITIGDATGTVENVTLRVTRLRDVSGIVWHIRNGAIEQVGNESQGWARAVVDFPVPYAADLADDPVAARRGRAGALGRARSGGWCCSTRPRCGARRRSRAARSPCGSWRRPRRCASGRSSGNCAPG